MTAVIVKETLRKCSSDPLKRSTTTTKQQQQQQQQQQQSAVSKCVNLTLDGYSYVIVATGPKGASADGDDCADSTTVAKTLPPSSNGDYTGSETLTILRRSSSRRKRCGRAGSTSSLPMDDAALEQVNLETMTSLPSLPSIEACENAALRLKCLLRLLDKGEVQADVLQKNLELAIQVLDSIYNDDTRRPVEDEDDLSEVRPDAVPPEVRAWLASTFTRQIASSRRSGEDKVKFRSVAQAIRAGILVERIYRRMSSSSLLQFPAEVARHLKLIDEWTFDVFALNDATSGAPLRYLGIDLLNRYGVIHKFKIPSNTLEAFLTQIEAGYCKHRNLYHNNIHAADVAQTVHYILFQTGLMNWLTDLEIFAALVAAVVHDYEHTGTTNSFHVMSGSETALLYNDRAVLENHHVSAAFRLLRDDDCNILVNLTRDEYREFRALVVDMVLATDMSCHFQQIKSAKNLLALCPHDAAGVGAKKSKILSLVLHCCDVAHPSKPWHTHRRWTDLLLEEFFRQGDLEKELSLPYSPLCDRNNTLVAESQIGFIEFIVEPSLTVMGDLLERVLLPRSPAAATAPSTPAAASAVDAAAASAASSAARGHRDSISEEPCEAAGDGAETSSSEPTTSTSTATATPAGESAAASAAKLRRPWTAHLEENKANWKELSIADAKRREEALRTSAAQSGHQEGDE